VTSSSTKLTTKQQIYVDSRLSGMSITASAAAAGCANPSKNGAKFEKNENVRKEMVKRMDKISEEVDFGRKEAHDMLMQAFINADTAMEQIAAVREMIKLHGLAKPVPVTVEHQHQHLLELDRMPLEQLMKLADMEDLTLEGEFRVVDPPKLIENGEDGRDAPS